ncbi:hypothetical protein EV174_001104 [Coemansia sp. RSA 2320]|nr:hypothetical protein EV174_001104 [Coemansia sp. RSA 2320]
MATDDMVTTGAFFTRATLRKLGVADSVVVVDPEATTGSGIRVGDKVKVLSLDKTWYTAVIVAIAGGKALVHYPGWEHSYNEWIQLESRRLLYRGKVDLSVGGSREALEQVDQWDEDCEEFDLQQAIREALGLAKKGGRGGTASAPAEFADTYTVVDEVAVATGLSTDLAGVLEEEKAAEELGEKCPPRPRSIELVVGQKSGAGGADSEAVVEAPAIPKELRIAKAREFNKSSNPYARQARADQGFCTDSGDDADGAQGSGQQEAQPSKATAENEIWQLVRGQYVTTGAFLTRRTIKCLAHNDSTGGIIQDHHGYYPGEIVEVMNANRSWYRGRVISYTNKKFLIHFMDWGHSHDEWVGAGSKRMRKSPVAASHEESEEAARKICAVLVDEHNAYVDQIERAQMEEAKEKAKRKPAPVRRAATAAEMAPAATAIPVNAQIAQLPGKAKAQSMEEDIDEGVEPISVECGYSVVPQLLRVKDYVRVYHKGMQVAARDRNKLWWKAEIVDIKTFRLRIHYTGFPSMWDEWMEMNTQRVMLAEEQPPAATGSAALAAAEDAASAGEGDGEGEDDSDGEEGGDGKAVDSDAGGVAAEETALTAAGPKAKARAPLSLRLALRALRTTLSESGERPQQDAGVFQLPTEHMAIKDYGLFLKVGDVVRIRDRDKQWYECTIIDFKHGRIRICFNGHPEEYNQWVAVNSDRIQVLHATMEGDGRLERVQREAQVAVRRKREKARARRQRRLTSQVSIASLVHVAESLEHIVDQRSSAGSGAGSANMDDWPLLERMVQDGGREAADGVPLLTRLHAEARCGAEHDSATWFVYCNQCRVVIRTFRYFCTACERPSDGFDYESFDLCLLCFTRRFPRDHAHAPAEFARAAVGGAEAIVAFTAAVLAAHRAAQGAERDADADAEPPAAAVAVAYERDHFAGCDLPARESGVASAESNLIPRENGVVHGQSLDLIPREYSEWGRLAAGLHGTATATDAATEGAVVGQHIASRVRCAFCGGGGPRSAFAGGRPFVFGDGDSARRFWAHTDCARFSPEVLVTDAGVWYNVAAALRRARTIKCAACHRRGASVGCFHERCQRSYHVACTSMAAAALERGLIFWCPRHRDAGPHPAAPSTDHAPVACACCTRRLTADLMWMVCGECPPDAAQAFNVCLTCYETPGALANHPHKKRCFRERLARDPARSHARRAPHAPCCHYCRHSGARRWRRGYGGVIMCDACFAAAHSLHDRDLFADDAAAEVEVVALNPFGLGQREAALVHELKDHDLRDQPSRVEDYAHSAYFTRDACAAPARAAAPPSQQPLGQLASYAPTDSMLFTLIVDSTYFDIPGRAPRWASHSGTDYHGTWLPQTVRRALLRYTRRGERVLSNFLGRGTDAIECFLLSRKCVGVDINPSAVALAQRNCSFTIDSPAMSVEFRPAIMHGDARALCDSDWPGATYFADAESFDHVLSHPPYKDCVLYSTNIDGDLSRFPGPEEFRREMDKVIATSWRLLRMDRHLTLGIGDNRAECFYIPISFHLIRSYIAFGFELDELIVKRQRYCQAFGLGTYLCVQFDFLMFTHEFIATLRKVSRHSVDLMYLPDGCYVENPAGLPLNDAHAESATIIARTLREVPASPIERKSVVMGSVWSFDHHLRYSFPQLCMSRMVERFGRDNSNWEHIDLALVIPLKLSLPPPPLSPPPPLPPSPLPPLYSPLLPDLPVSSVSNSDSDAEVSDESSSAAESPAEFQDNGTRAGNYERQRQRQIQQNRAQLLHLGLVSELGENSTDFAHYQKMVAMAPRLPVEDTPLALIVVPHIPNSLFSLRHIQPYRRALVQITHDASHRLCPSGLLILGIQDVRDEHGKLWPLGMLVLEDVQRAVGAIRLRLKEFIVVVEHGHARKRDDVVSRDSYVEEKCVVGSNGPARHLPIVHAYYLVFMKLK